MTEFCPYYTLGEKKRGGGIAVGSDDCRAWKRRLCEGCTVGGPLVNPKKEPEPDPAPEAVSAADEDDGVADEKLGTALGRLRVQKGMTKAELARAIGVHPTYIGKWESGLNKPSRESLKALDAFFGSDLIERFGGDSRSSGKQSNAEAGAEKPSSPPAECPGDETESRNPDWMRAWLQTQAASGDFKAHPGVNKQGDPDLDRSLLMEIVREAAQAREDYHLFLCAALKAISKQP